MRIRSPYSSGCPDDWPPFRPASLALSSPGWKLPLEAWPPSEAMSLFKQVLAVVCYITNAFTNLLVGIHRSKSALVARLPTLPSNILDLLLRSVGEITRVGVIGHGDIYKVCSVVKSMERYVIDLIKLEYCREDLLRIYVRLQARPVSWVSLTEAPLTSIWCLRQNNNEFIMIMLWQAAEQYDQLLLRQYQCQVLLISCLCSRPERPVSCRSTYVTVDFMQFVLKLSIGRPVGKR
jgi:hypothetical protein